MNLTSTQLYFRLLGYVKRYWRTFSISIFGMAIAAATEPLLPALVKPMLDGTFVHKDDFIIHWTPLILLLLFFVRGLTSFAGTYAIGWVGNKVVMDLRNEMFNKLLTLPTRYYDDHATGNLISKLTFDVTQVTSAATNVVTVSIKDSIMIIGLLGWLLFLNWKLTLFSMIMFPIMAVIIKIFNRRLRSASRNAQNSMGAITQVIEESVAAHKVVKLFGGQQYERSRFNEQANWVRRHIMKLSMAAAANVPVVQMIAACAVSAIIYYATQQVRNNEITVGGFVSFVAAMMMLTSPIKRITGVSEFIQRGLAASESVFALLDTPGETEAGSVTLGRAEGHITFEHVSLSYDHDNRLALREVNLDIPRGQTIALVGASGSGKSTMANLIPRFYLPTSGRIMLDGHDIADLTLDSLRANIALVSQEVFLFNDTIAANIAYGQEHEVPETEIVAAAEAAHAMEFICEMPEGLQTLVGERGVKLSGGQRQRIAIARAILKNAPILILDEATSALDSEAERHVQSALETLMKGRTSLVIAHRLSTIEKADRIVVMQKGEIVETGAHSELLAKNGVYAQLHRIQFAAAMGETAEQS
jgi:subfamily B ATP-binding cassette protein MsbA